MDSHIQGGVPISATQAAPKVPFATSTGIRAPLTIDDNDFNYSASSGGRKGSFFGSFSSDSGLESDEFETASGSDRPFLADIDDEIVEETHFEKEYVVSRPIVINPCDDNFSESSSDRHLEPNFVGDGVVSESIAGNHCDESSNIRKIRISRESLLYSNEELVESNDSSEEFSECGPFVADTEEEDAVGIYCEVDDNDSLSGLTIVDNDNDLMTKQSIPIAQVCWSSDDDFLGDEVSSDGSVSGAVRVVDFEVTERFENAPKIGVLNVEKVENSAHREYMAEEDYAFSDSHDGVIVNSNVKAAGYYLLTDVVEDNFADKTVKVNEGFQELQRNSFALNISASENLGSEQVVQKSDWEVQSHASDVPANTELVNTSVTEEEGQSLNNADFGVTPTAERSEACGSNSYAADIVQSLVMEDEYYSGANLGATPTAERSESFGRNRCGDDIIQSLVMEYEYYCGSEAVSQAGLQNSNVDLSSILGKNDSVLLEREEDFLKYDETLTQEGSDRASGVVLPEQLLTDTLSSGESVVNDLHNVGAQTMSESEEELELEARKDPLGEEISASSPAAPRPTTGVGSDVINVTVKSDDGDFGTPKHSFVLAAQPDRASGVVLPEQLLTDTLSSGESVVNDLHSVGAHTMSESEEELEARKDQDPLGEEISASSPAVPGPTTGIGSDVINVTVKSDDGDFGTPKHSFVLAAQPDHPHTLASPELMASKESGDMSNVEENKKLLKLQQLRIKILRLALKLNQSFDDRIAAKVLDKIFLAAGRPSAESFNFEFAKQTAMLLEAEGAGHMDFSLNILVIGKSGVGKSATINSLFGEDIATTNPFQPSTTSVKMIKRTVNGVQVRVLDTPGLRSYPREQSFNRRVLLSIKKHMKKFPPDVVLYVDRLDMQFEDLNDIPLLKAVTCYLGSSIWVKTIVTLTHATSTPPEVLSGSAFSYQFFVTRQSEAVRQLISHAVGGGHAIKPGPVNVSLVENQAVSELSENVSMLLSDGSWREKLLFLCYSLKILSEIDLIIKPKAFFDYRKFFGFNNHSVPILSSFLQSNGQPISVITWDDENFESELVYSPDSDQHSEDEYDQELPFKPLRRSQISKLKQEQRRAYFEEYDYHEQLLQKKQMRDEVTSLELVKKQRVKSDVFMEEFLDQQAGDHEALAVPILPPPFDVKNLAYKYQLLESPFSHLAGPILDFHDWDNDCGYDGVDTEDNLTIAGQFPGPISVHLKKDKIGFKDRSLFGLSLMRWGGDLVWGLNMHSQFSVGRSTRVCVHAGVHSKKSGQVSFRVNSSDDIPIAILGFLPIAKMIFRSIFAQSSER